VAKAAQPKKRHINGAPGSADQPDYAPNQQAVEYKPQPIDPTGAMIGGMLLGGALGGLAHIR
jgi:hypothetical protein